MLRIPLVFLNNQKFTLMLRKWSDRQNFDVGNLGASGLNSSVCEF